MPADNRPVRVGIYGTGRFANQTHLPNLSKLDDVELVAASDPNPNNLAATAQKYSIARTYADPHQMLAEEQLDALYSVVPAFARTDVEATAAAQGDPPSSARNHRQLPWLLRGALPMRSAEGDAISTVCFRERYRPLFQEARRLLADKAVTTHPLPEHGRSAVARSRGSRPGQLGLSDGQERRLGLRLGGACR